MFFSMSCRCIVSVTPCIARPEFEASGRSGDGLDGACSMSLPSFGRMGRLGWDCHMAGAAAIRIGTLVALLEDFERPIGNLPAPSLIEAVGLASAFQGVGGRPGDSLAAVLIASAGGWAWVFQAQGQPQGHRFGGERRRREPDIVAGGLDPL
jgi:hypothetical protein